MGMQRPCGADMVGQNMKEIGFDYEMYLHLQCEEIR